MHEICKEVTPIIGVTRKSEFVLRLNDRDTQIIADSSFNVTNCDKVRFVKVTVCVPRIVGRERKHHNEDAVGVTPSDGFHAVAEGPGEIRCIIEFRITLRHRTCDTTEW